MRRAVHRGAEPRGSRLISAPHTRLQAPFFWFKRLSFGFVACPQKFSFSEKAQERNSIPKRGVLLLNVGTRGTPQWSVHGFVHAYTASTIRAARTFLAPGTFHSLATTSQSHGHYNYTGPQSHGDTVTWHHHGTSQRDGRSEC